MVLISIATYNELDNLPSLIESILQHVPEAHVRIIDDNSPDGTGRWCDEYAAHDARLSCQHRAGKLGLGTATIEGLRHAIDGGYQYVITMDADWSHDPRYLTDLMAGMESGGPGPVDVMIGSRYTAGGGIEGWPWRRRCMSRAINGFARWWLRLPVQDTSGAFRCYRTATLQKLNLQQIRSQGYSVFEELLWRLQRQGARMSEQPITFVDRHWGESKITLTEAITSVAQLIRLRFGP